MLFTDFMNEKNFYTIEEFTIFSSDLQTVV